MHLYRHTNTMLRKQTERKKHESRDGIPNFAAGPRAIDGIGRSVQGPGPIIRSYTALCICFLLVMLM